MDQLQVYLLSLYVSELAASYRRNDFQLIAFVQHFFSMPSLGNEFIIDGNCKRRLRINEHPRMRVKRVSSDVSEVMRDDERERACEIACAAIAVE